MRLIAFIARRLVLLTLTLLLLSLMMFYTTSFVPVQERANLFISPQSINQPGHDVWSQIEDIIALYRLNEPFYVQYFNWLIFLVSERSLGYSFYNGIMVSDAIMRSFPATFELVMLSAPFITFFGVKLGEFSARRAYEKRKREDPVDFAVRAATALAYSIPAFFTGLILISIFYLTLHWVTPGRISDPSDFFIVTHKWNYYTGLYTVDALLNGQFWIFVDALKHLVLPAITLTFSMLPVVVKVTRSSMLSEFVQGYVVAAKAKGLQNTEIVSRVRRNSLISILTVSSVLFAQLLTGVTVTEYVFSINGIGFLAINAARRYDISLLIGVSLFFCLLFVAINLVVDVIYTYIDPRVKL